MRKTLRVIAWLFGSLLALLLIAALVALWTFRGSLARLDGEQALRGLSAAAAVERDSLGVFFLY